MSERVLDPPEHWPTAEELNRAVSPDTLVILPEEVAEVDGTLTAFFATEAQALRVKAKEAGLEPLLLAPPGAAVAGHSEYAADWILPAVVTAALAFPSGLAANVAADLIHDRMAGAASPTSVPAIVCYQEARIEADGRMQLHRTEGPAEELEKFLRESGIGAVSKLTPRPPSP